MSVHSAGSWSRILCACTRPPQARTARQTESVRGLYYWHSFILPPDNGARTGACAWRASTERAQESVGFREGVVDSRSCSTGVVEGCIPTGFPEYGAGCEKKEITPVSVTIEPAYPTPTVYTSLPNTIFFERGVKVAATRTVKE